MKNGLKKGLSVTLLLLIIGGGILWWPRQGSPRHHINATQAVVAPVTPAPAVQNMTPAGNGENVLNLALPPEPLMDRKIALSGSQHDLHDLFKPEEKESTVKVGGRLILDEKPPPPNAAVWDQVKGAEVGITIKTQ